ncbi:PAS/PAC sensor signal transduction histidine kinase [Paraburkholderia eburnea]|uniref:histidine kinase n=1 Tax=Paraburkholderia eburnea TaxID=1189126 RepID=A0A2S4LY92_9BURK|nr:PAS domain-containing sensor histidine kinase [Paraburkholderia eburnea]POR47426.1 PAS/PAC sensor signal transduction histidine kinase [Paraburkholderia eburnea]PRZ19014.1 PAS/PAC sensor signal transduction histidine kinase [Paraburkholderia eburnea]
MTSLVEADFHRLLDALTLCVLLHDAQSKAIVWANRAACEALGFSVDELIPLKAGDMTRPEPKYDRALAIAAMNRSATEGPQVYEWCYRSRTGSDMLSEAIATTVHLEERDVVMVQFRDISAEEGIKRKLRAHETRLREFMQDLGEGVALLNEAAEIQYISESGRRLLDLAAGDAPGAIVDHIGDEEAQRLLQQLAQAPTDGPSIPCRYRSADGEHWLRLTCRHIELEDDLRGVLIHFRDVTDVVRTEEARRAEARLLEYAGRYNAMGEMAMAIAHELSQPVAAIRNFVEGAIQRLSNAAPLESVIWGLRAADRQAEHAATIIKSVREYVARRDPNIAVVDLRTILSEAAWFVQLRAREANVNVHVELSDAPLLIECERVLIGQVVLNLAFNAIDALASAESAQKALTIGACMNEGQALVFVRDNGPGISEGHERLFDGFSSSKETGNGIGLSLCKSIIARHGGVIRALPVTAGGLECRFWLPLAGVTAAN